MAHHVHRHTVWQTPDGATVMVECCRIDSDTWDELSRATETVSERADAAGTLVLACSVAGDLADGQYPGQGRLEFA